MCCVYATGNSAVIGSCTLSTHFHPASVARPTICVNVLEALDVTGTLSAQLAAPFIVFGLIFYLGLGVLSRLMPQIQIFFIAMPANILLGFLLMVAVIGAVMTWYLDHVALAIRPFLGSNGL